MLRDHVPTSTIILAIATCIPFGLAIRDTASGKYERELEPDENEEDALDRYGREQQALHDGDGDEEDYRDRAARLEAEDRQNRIAVAEFEAEQEVKRLERAALVQSLYGAEVASMGSAFEKIVLGARVGQASVSSTSSVDLMLLDDGIATHTLFIKIQNPEYGVSSICTSLDRSLREAWGEDHSLSARRIWVNNPAAQRAVYDPDTCELRYEKVATIDAWLSKAETSLVPMWAVGKPAKLLLERLGERTSSTIEDDQITWAVRGLGAGTGPTQLIADVRGGKVVSVFASVETDFETQAAIADRVNELTGKQSDDNGVWKSVPRIAMGTGSVQMFLTIGQRVSAVPGGTRSE